MKAILLTLCSMAAVGLAWMLAEEGHADGELVLLNVSYDPTRELWEALNEKFRAEHPTVRIKQSHGGSSAQAGAVFSGLGADVVSLALWSDVDILRTHGKIKDGWEDRLPHRSVAYYSTIVFVVRAGNPRGIHDWDDLIRPGVEVITPNPKTSGNGRLSFLAAWGAALRKRGSEYDARRFVTQLYKQHVKVLDSGARGSTTTFAQNLIGDVHLTWENEAHLEVKEFPGRLEIIYPSCSIKAEPPVAVVDANVDRKGTRAAAEAYLKFLYTEPAQEIIAQHFYRPINEKVLRHHGQVFPQTTTLFPITDLVLDWDAVQEKFFSTGGVFESIYQPGE